jgi:hypothetical protein
MNKIIKVASVGIMAAGIVALGLVGATAAQAAGLKPVGQEDFYSIPQGGTLTIPAPGILSNDSDPESDPLHVGNAFSYQAADFIQVNLDGSFTFTPDPSFYGQGGFHYYPADDLSLGADTAVYITITPTVPTPPTVLVANADSYSTPMDTVLTVPVATGLLANDSGPAYLYAVNGSGTDVVVQQDGAFVYTPVAGFVGTRTFGYRTTDGLSQSNDALVTIEVTGPVAPPVVPPVAPTANPDSYSTVQDTVLTVPASGLLANDSFPAGAVIDIDDLSGEIVAQLDGSFVYTPAAGFVGLKEFAYRMTDGTTLSAWAHVGITVTAAPAAPAGPAGPATPPAATPPTPAGSTPAGPAASADDDLPTLAYTGTAAPASWLVVPGLALVGLGGLGLWVSRRRSAQP